MISGRTRHMTGSWHATFLSTEPPWIHNWHPNLTCCFCHLCFWILSIILLYAFSYTMKWNNCLPIGRADAICIIITCRVYSRADLFLLRLLPSLFPCIDFLSPFLRRNDIVQIQSNLLALACLLISQLKIRMINIYNLCPIQYVDKLQRSIVAIFHDLIFSAQIRPASSYRALAPQA